MVVDIRTTNVFVTNKIKNSMILNNSKIGNLERQVSDGKAANNYADLVGTTSIEGLVSNKEVKRALESKVTNNTDLNYKLAEIERVEKAMLGVLTDSLRLCQRARDPGVSGSIDISALAKNQLEQIRLLLNSSFQGQKLFAGGMTDIASTVGDIANNSNIINGAVTANYYNGDDYILNYAIARNRDLAYGITAGSPVFQNFIAAHNFLLNGDTDSALSYLLQAKTDIGNLLIETGSNSLIVKQQIELDKNSISSLFESVANVEDADILDAMSKMAELTVQLKASFMLTNKIADLSLVNYMR